MPLCGRGPGLRPAPGLRRRDHRHLCLEAAGGGQALRVGSRRRDLHPPCTIHQHFNADPARPARLISCINRIYKNSGLNDLEQIEDAPEYDPKVVLTAELMKQYIERAAKAA